ncbi:MAG: hypothetical protein NZ920_05655 [Aigarchaeota archaeon]|nr:hypothetical protein [Aigarchaeota archaeon]MDW8092823.1 hypothetical protein [Nitrososphaerota archaeon]
MRALKLNHKDPPWSREREIIEIREASTDTKYGKDPWSRDLSELLDTGFIAVDKHRGSSSHSIVFEVKRLLGLEAAGHGGTLDARGRSQRLRRTPSTIGESDEMHRGRDEEREGVRLSDEVALICQRRGPQVRFL